MYSLGIELGTKSCSTMVLDLESGDSVYQGGFEYDSAFPHYGTRDGFLPSQDETVRHTSPLMMLEALEQAFYRMKSEGVDLSRIAALKVAAIPHCTVYADARFGAKMGMLDPQGDLSSQLGPCVTRATSPTSDDRSACVQAEYLASTLAERGGISFLTGNDAACCFSAAQVLKWATEAKRDFGRTAHIFILSSFLTSVLAAKMVSVDTSDGWGTNLNNLNLIEPDWSDEALHAARMYLESNGVGEDLKGRLGSITRFDEPAGPVNRYFVDKFGLSSDAAVLVGTSRESATLLGCGGKMVIDLGNGFTVRGTMETVAPSALGEYKTYGFKKGTAMSVMSIDNGGSVHKRFIRKYVMQGRAGVPSGMDWKRYEKVGGKPVLSQDEKLMLPFIRPEKVPPRKKGVVRAGFSIDDAKSNVRSLHLSQVLSLALHSRHLDVPDRVCLVGGGARNGFLAQLVSDVFGANTHVMHNPELMPALGCALSGAAYSLDISYEEAAERYIAERRLSRPRHPNPDNRPLVPGLLERYEKLEAGPSSWG